MAGGEVSGGGDHLGVTHASAVAAEVVLTHQLELRVQHQLDQAVAAVAAELLPMAAQAAALAGVLRP